MKRLLAIIAALLLISVSATAFAQKLVVAHDTNFKPFEFKQNGEFVGFDIDIWKEVAKRNNLDYEFQPMDFNGIIPGLQAGSIDAAIAGMTIKPSRQEVVDFSDGYYDSGLVILVRSDNNDVKTIEDLKDKIVATKLATSSVDLAQQYIPKKNIKLFPNNDNMFMELMTGGADAVIFDMPVVKDFEAKAGQGMVKVVGPVYQGQAYGIAFPKGSDLVSGVNKALADTKADGTYNELYIKWFGYAPK
ncbi:MAG: glutamine ABC transporter substrate-binding protein GlnH [Desulfovibrionales bacterium]|nr:glutamine ABC transporter substrate-binding protein GlnH [Desulfovibrionales bacterium]